MCYSTVAVFVQGAAGVQTLPNFCATVANGALLIVHEGKAKFPPSSVHASICFPLRKIFAYKSSVYIVNK